jgi:hypothetical protein
VLTCAACGGVGCGECTDGQITIVGCPLEQVPTAVWAVLEAAGLLEQGLAPVAGGLLDQAAGFLDAARLISAEKTRLLQES